MLDYRKKKNYILIINLMIYFNLVKFSYAKKKNIQYLYSAFVLMRIKAVLKSSGMSVTILILYI